MVMVSISSYGVPGYVPEVWETETVYRAQTPHHTTPLHHITTILLYYFVPYYLA